MPVCSSEDCCYAASTWRSTSGTSKVSNENLGRNNDGSCLVCSTSYTQERPFYLDDYFNYLVPYTATSFAVNHGEVEQGGVVRDPR